MFGAPSTRRPVVAGWGQTEIGRHPGKTPDELALEALYAALEMAKLRPQDLEGVVTAPQGYMRAQPRLRPQRIAQELGVQVRSLAEIEGGGASALMAFKLACMEIALGNLNVMAVIGSQAERAIFGERITPSDADRTSHLNAMFGPQLGLYGLLMPLPLHALAAQRYIHEHGVDRRDAAELPVRLRYNASLNMDAELRTPLSVEDVLASRLVAPPIRSLEMAPYSDGAACLVVMSEERAWQGKQDGAVVVGWGEAHEPDDFIPFGSSLTEVPWMRQATDEALKRAGRIRDDIGVVEVCGVTSYSELITYESMGLFRPGEAVAAVKRGETALNGGLPINTSGGRLSLGHPAAATPLLMVIEVAKQLTSRAGNRQVTGIRLGLVQADHGIMNGGAVCALGV